MLKYDNSKEKAWRDAGFDIATPQECADDFNEDVIDDNGVVYHPQRRKTLYLLKNIVSGEPMEMLSFDNGIGRDTIQKSIEEMANEFVKKEDEYGCVDGLEMVEYIVENLREEFHCDVLNWDNTDNLYY